MTKDEFELRRIADALEGIETALAGIAKAESERKSFELSGREIRKALREEARKITVVPNQE